MLKGLGHIVTGRPAMRLLLEAQCRDDRQLAEGAEGVTALEQGISQLREPPPVFEIRLSLQNKEQEDFRQ